MENSTHGGWSAQRESRYRSRLPQPQSHGLVSAKQLVPPGCSPASVETEPCLATDAVLALSLGALPNLRGSSGGHASYRGNHLGGQARTQFGHHFGDRTKNETHIHHHYSNKSSDAYIGGNRAGTIGQVFNNMQLVTSGLIQYVSAVKSVSKIRHLSRKFSELKRDLEVESAELLNSVELILQDRLLEQELWSLFQEIQNRDRWQRPHIDRAFQRALGGRYDDFLNSTTLIDLALVELKASLLINGVGEAPFMNTGKGIEESFAGLKFGLKMEHYFKHLMTIQDHNKAIQELTSQLDELDSVPTLRRCPNFESTRSYATSVYAMIKEILATTCTAGHRISLFLSPRRGASIEGMDIYQTDAISRVVLHHKVFDGDLSLPWTVEEAELRALRPEKAQTGGSSLASKPSSKVRFQLTPAEVPVACSSRTLPGRLHTEQYESKPSDRVQKAEFVRELCKTLKHLRATRLGSRACLGYLSDGAGIHGLYWPSESIVKHWSAVETTLADTLNSRPGQSLSLLDRRRLALALAVGTLQLYDTPWLSKQWGKHEVLLFTLEGRLVTSGPFVSVDLTNAGNRGEYFKRCRSIRNETVFALAVILIELALKRPFEELKTSEDDDEGAQRADFNAADRLTRVVEFEAGSRYANVVRRCVRGEFDCIEIRLDDPKVQQKMYSSVVAMLEEELTWIEPAESR